MSESDRVFRDFNRYNGDGKTPALVAAPLPVGDPSSGVWNPAKKDIRDLLNTFEAPLTPDIPAAIQIEIDELERRVTEHALVAANFVQPARRLMPTGDSYILASDDNRLGIHLCLASGSYRINVSAINFGCFYTIMAASADSIRPVIECGPGLVFVGMVDGAFGADATAIEMQGGESITITKGLNNSIFVVAAHRNLDTFFSSVGSPSVDTLWVQQPDNGKYTMYMTRTIAANGDIISTPTRPGRTVDFAGALTMGSVIVDGAVGSVIPFKVDAHAAGTTINIVNTNGASVRGTVAIRDVNWSF